MALKSMSVKKSDEIMTLYFALMAKFGEDSSTIYPYSALKGYDIFDIDNALKIFLANQIHRKYLSEAEIIKLRNWGGQGLWTFNTSFAPDEFVYKLNKLEKHSTEYWNMKDDFILNPPTGMVKIFYDEDKETTESFFDFCLSLGREHPNYWKEVYNRLGIENK